MEGSAAIGRYQVVRVVGQGAMGRVLEVCDPLHPERRLAVKQALSRAIGPAGLVRFRREAELLARVRHPGVVPVHELGESPDGPWLLMELVEGESLGELLRRRGRLEPREAAGIVADLAAAVAALHDAGVLHRDLKPDNALVRPDGTPVLIDFGLAWAEDVERLTQTGQVMGSPAFMSPEQASGAGPGRLTPQSDVWSLGATLFMLLVGRAPFRGGGPAAVVAKVRSEPPQWPGRGEPSIPRPLRRLLEQTLSKDPLDRPAGARGLEASLRRWLRGEREPGAWIAPVLAAGVAVLGLVAGALIWTNPLASTEGAGAAAVGSPALATPATSTAATPVTSPPAPEPEPEPPLPDLPPVRRLGHRDVPVPVGVAWPPRFAGPLPRSLPRSGPVTWTGAGLPSDHPAHAVIRLWPDGKVQPFSLEIRNEEVEALLVTDPLHAVVATRIGPTRRWYLQVLEHKQTRPPPVELTLDEVPDEEPIAALAARAGGGHVAVATTPAEGEPARAWLLDLGRPSGGPSVEMVLGSSRNAARDILFLPDGTLLVATASGVSRWLPPQRIASRTREERPSEAAAGAVAPRALGFAPGRGAWVGCEDGSIRRLVLAAGALGDPIGPPHEGPVLALRFDPDGQRMYSLSAGEVRAWRAGEAGWEVAGSVVDWPSPLGGLAISPDGEELVVGLHGRGERWPAGWFEHGRRRYATVPTR